MNLNCKISSNIDDLENIKKIYSWIPGENNIRPDKEIIDKKLQFWENIHLKYNKMSDYILNVHFNLPVIINDNNKFEVLLSSYNNIEKFIFMENTFPYNLEENTNHYILWYTFIPSDYDVNKHIFTEIYKILNHTHFNFVWYENPKMNVPEIYHLQVFWIDNTI